MRAIFDIESNGLLNTITKIHCLYYYDIDTKEKGSITDYKDIAAFVTQPNLTLIGHNIVRYDIPALKLILNVQITAKLIDTLGISWYLYPERDTHKLEDWGEDVGIEKPAVYDWNNEPIEVYIHRCREDVKINWKIWDIMWDYLKRIYATDEQALRLCAYLSFKLDCAREQEEEKVKTDIETVKANKQYLEEFKQEKFDALADAMPTVKKYKIVSRPDKIYKKDGTVSKVGENWLNLLEQNNLPDYHNNAIEVLVGEERGNPNSPAQIKDWLFSLGWEPDVFEYVKKDKSNFDSEIRKIPQVNSKEKDGSLSDSVLALLEKEPSLESLEGYSKAGHRIGLLKAFLESADDKGYVIAGINGLTNTLRMQHVRPIANLPSIPKAHWERIRGCIVAPSDEYTLCGSDMSGLEDNTKQHYMYFFDPAYVKQLRTPGYDSHIDIAVRAKDMSYDEGEFYKWYDRKKEGKVYNYVPTLEFESTKHSILEDKRTFNQLQVLPSDLQAKLFKVLKPIRLKDKKGNFAAVYGAGVPKLAITLKVSMAESKEFHTAYWVRNKAVKDVASSTIVKTIDRQMWQYNPVSQFWYTLRFDKDRFSTLNQGTAVYAFDTWVRKVRQKGIKITLQYHDEILFSLKKGGEEGISALLLEALNEVNAELKLNVPLAISIAYGPNYAEVH